MAGHRQSSPAGYQEHRQRTQPQQPPLIEKHFTGLTATIEQMRTDRQLEEALSAGPDPLHLAAVFGISHQTQSVALTRPASSSPNRYWCSDDGPLRRRASSPPQPTGGSLIINGSWPPLGALAPQPVYCQ
jgi:hypothetical protein